MSTLGKVLLFVNVLLAFGVLFLASQDYAKRRELNTAALKHQIVFDGLAVEPIKELGELDAETMAVSVAGPNGITTALPVSKKVVDGVFTGVDTAFGGSGTPKTQLDEVNAVYTKLSQTIDGMANDAARVAFLCGSIDAKGFLVPGLLMTLSDTFEERQAVRGLFYRVPQGQMAASAKEARDRLKAKFDAVTQAPNPQRPEDVRKQVEEIKGKIAASPKDNKPKEELAKLSAGGPTGPTGSDQERRVKIAQLLMQLNPAPAWQKRVALTVGLRTYLLAITEQVSRIDAIATQTRDARFADQQNHDVEYEQLASFALENSKLVDQQTRVVEGLAKTLADDQAIFDKRTTQLNNLKQELATLTAAVNAQLAAQKKVETDLFAVQREVGLTLRETGKLEGDLRTKEGK
jgi:hypothetical protein